MAPWPSGKAKVCNTSIPGPIPGGASKNKKHFVRSAIVFGTMCSAFAERDVHFVRDVSFGSDVRFAREYAEDITSLCAVALPNKRALLLQCKHNPTMMLPRPSRTSEAYPEFRLRRIFARLAAYERARRALRRQMRTGFRFASLAEPGGALCGSTSNKKSTPWGAFLVGGATRNRTGDRGVADLCLTAWP